jgi:hypothetical protein
MVAAEAIPKAMVRTQRSYLARFCGSASILHLPLENSTQSRRTTRLWVAADYLRFGPSACATPGAFLSIAPMGACSPVTWARTTGEEVDIITKAGNFGWNIMEGNHCYPPNVTSCNMESLIPPISEYGHNATGGISIIGGFVYRGSSIADLVGTYVFGDLSSGHIWELKQDAMGIWQVTPLLTHNLTVSSFGQDAAGELYVIDYGNGAVLRLTTGP